MSTVLTNPYMNGVERLIVHNQWRWLIQRFYEIPILQSLGLEIKGRHILEVGCGTGYAAQQLVKRYGACSVLGVDVDPTLVEWQHCMFQPQGISFVCASVLDLPIASESFETVIGFGLLHHVPDWQAAIAEIARVCKPGATYALDDFTASGLSKWYHSIFDHPRSNRFTTGQLVSTLIANGFRIRDVTHRLAGDVVFLVAEKL